MKPYSSHAQLCILILALTFFSCKAKYDFNGRVGLDNDAAGRPVPNQVISETQPCGTGKLEFDYSVVADQEMGILEIENKGACDIDVEVTRQLPPGTVERGALPDDIKNFTVKKGDPPRINAFTIPQQDNGGKLHFKISCKQAETDAGCSFYYRFSTAKNVKDKDPVTPDISANETGLTVVPGATTPPGANQCVTPAGNEKVLKIITNRSKTDLVLTFEAVSACSCEFFFVYGEPTSKKNKRAAAAEGNPQNDDRKGKVVIPKDKVVMIKAKCERGSRTDDPCDGTVVNYKLTAKDNL